MKELLKSSAAALLVLFGFVLLTVSVQAQSTFVYVNNSTPFVPNSVSAFSVDASGGLTPVPGSPFPTLGTGTSGFIQPNRITTVGSFLYAANTLSTNITGFSVNPITGVLTLVPGSPFALGGSGILGSSSFSLAATPDGQFLYAAAAPGDIISAFRIGSNGALTPVTGFPVPIGNQPDVIRVSPDGKFLAVALFSGVAMFSIGSDGTLTPVPGSPFSSGGVTTYLDINCASDLLLADADSGSSPTSTAVSVFTIAPNGVLSLVAGSPFTFSGGTGSNGVLSVDDRHLFVSNLLGNSISSLNVESGGSLTEVTGSPFAIPRVGQPFALATNQAGTLLYVLETPTTVAGTAVIGFSIDNNGGLSPLPNAASSPELGRGGLAVFPPKACGPVAAAPTWTQKFPAQTPPARSGGAMAYDSARQQVVLFGGSSPTPGTLGDTWGWDGNTWTQKFPTTSPPARSAPAMDYDSARNEVVLFGGGIATMELNDTWVWDGTNWTQRFPSSSPPPRNVVGGAYDAARQQFVLFGGVQSHPFFMLYGDTWVWDGSNWTQKFPAHSPSPRGVRAMAYDAARQQVVLFGGSPGIGVPAADTWVWDGADWTQKSPSIHPSERYDSGLAYDTARQQILLFGGVGPPCAGRCFNYLDDTWVWDGTNWTQKFPAAKPSARATHNMAGDSAHAQVVLFGGSTDTIAFTDTWVWGVPSTVPPPTITSVSPTSGTQGQTITNFTVNGNNFQPGAMLSFSGAGIAVNSYSSRTATQIVASISIEPAAAPSVQDVIVTNPDGQRATKSGAFTVNFSGGQPAISVSPSPIIFPPTLLHRDFQECAKVNNTGTAILLIFSITAPSPFQLVGQPASIPAGGQDSFCVDFFATGPGPFTGDLVIVSNSPNSPTVIPLLATVLLPGLSISKIEPIQVVFEPDVNDDGVLDLVAGKKAAVLVSLQIDNFEGLRDDDAVKLEVSLGGVIVPSRTITKVELLSDPFFDRQHQGASLIVKKIDLYFKPTVPADNQIILLHGSLVDSGGASLPQSTNGPQQIGRSVTVKQTNSLVLAYVRVLRCTSTDACYGPFKKPSPEEDVDTFTTRAARTVSEGNRFIGATYPVPDGSPLSPPVVGDFSDGDPDRCVLGIFCKGILGDLIDIFNFGKKLDPRADRIIGVVPSDYFSYHGVNAVGIARPIGFSWRGIQSVLVRRDHLTTAAHEIGHTYGLPVGRLEEYSSTSQGNVANGFWVSFSESRGVRMDSRSPGSVICFMGDKDDECPSAIKECNPSQFGIWVDNEDFKKLFQQFRTTADPALLLVNGVLHKDGAIELGKWYWLPSGKPVLPSSESGSIKIQFVDFGGSAVQDVSFDPAFVVHIDPVGVFDTDISPFAFALPIPPTAATVRIQRAGIQIFETNLTVKLLHDGVDSIPDAGFVQNPAQRRKALHNKIDALGEIFTAQNLQAAREKLTNDIRKRLQDWLLDTYPVRNRLQLTKTELLELVDDLIGRLP